MLFHRMQRGRAPVFGDPELNLRRRLARGLGLVTPVDRPRTHRMEAGTPSLWPTTGVEAGYGSASRRGYQHIFQPDPAMFLAKAFIT